MGPGFGFWAGFWMIAASSFLSDKDLLVLRILKPEIIS
jgi:hypothetical protein